MRRTDRCFEDFTGNAWAVSCVFLIIFNGVAMTGCCLPGEDPNKPGNGTGGPTRSAELEQALEDYYWAMRLGSTLLEESHKSLHAIALLDANEPDKSGDTILIS